MNRVFTPLQQFLITWLLILAVGWATIGAIRYIGELVSILVTAGLIAFLLNYAVARLQVLLPRPIAAVLVYLLAGMGVVLIGLTIVPPVVHQAKQFISNVPTLLDSGREQFLAFQDWSQLHNLPFDFQFLGSQFLSQLQVQSQAIAGKSLGLVLGTFGWVIDLVLILVISFYMLLDGERIWKGFTQFLSPQVRDVLTISLERNLQKFVSGQLLLGLFMAIVLTIAFWLLKVPFFLLFSVFIGLMEVIPFIGATLGIATVCLVVVFIDGWLALQVLTVAVVVQQVKDNLIAPRILGNLTGLSPVIILASLLLGARVGELLGVILAIPLTGVLKSIVEIALDPALPPQTGSFFCNPVVATAAEMEMSLDSAQPRPPSAPELMAE
ncbi:AI-2E family transporter [Trichothermofontia sichuanensis B231]|uniref:AI-2E family transporter n=1 Tax=Trichothermofontia sichuanensis TaxID=3045816 RepID=UPI0022462808|nr:AI-2E family transporter [Trichothermofontia sichuanensis]UZQ55608.1 AI-2E family transporter [Trichothermofontia sichuanensis B231]